MDANYIYLGTPAEGAFVSNDAGLTWGIRNNWLINLAIHCFTFMGSSIFVATEDGNTWQNAGLGSYAEVLSSTSLNNHLYAGTNGLGLYYSANGGETWTEWNDGFQNKNIYSLAICGEEIFAGICYGYGLWKRRQLSVGIMD